MIVSECVRLNMQLSSQLTSQKVHNYNKMNLTALLLVTNNYANFTHYANTVVLVYCNCKTWHLIFLKYRLIYRHIQNTKRKIFPKIGQTNKNVSNYCGSKIYISKIFLKTRPFVKKLESELLCLEISTFSIMKNIKMNVICQVDLHCSVQQLLVIFDHRALKYGWSHFEDLV